MRSNSWRTFVKMNNSSLGEEASLLIYFDLIPYSDPAFGCVIARRWSQKKSSVQGKCFRALLQHSTVNPAAILAHDIQAACSQEKPPSQQSPLMSVEPWVQFFPGACFPDSHKAKFFLSFSAAHRHASLFPGKTDSHGTPNGCLLRDCASSYSVLE